MLLDSRVLVDEGALAYVITQVTRDPSRLAWNAYVVTDAEAPLVGLFWDVPTHVFWGRFLRSPRPFDLTADTFDAAPKGTTMFFAAKPLLDDAFRHAWPEGDAKLVSDDTRLLRWIAETHTIRIDPAFSATYRPRTSVRGFVRHTFDRGTLFVDSYAGTSTLRSAVLLGLVLAPVAVLAAVVALVAVGRPTAALSVIAAVVVLALAPIVPAAVNRCPRRSLLAYAACLPLFVGPFWLGLVRGVFVHRGAFSRGAALTSRTRDGEKHA
jgi:hypothetical protein